MGDQKGWTFETLRVHLEALIETLHHEVEGREGLWRQEYEARFDGVTQHADEVWKRYLSDRQAYWDRYLDDRSDLVKTIEREDRNLGHRIDDLRLYHDDSIRTTERLVNNSFVSSEKAVNKAEQSMDKRLEALNEFRQALTDQQQTFIKRQEFDAQHTNLVDRVNALQSRIERSEGSSIGKNQMWGYAIAIVAALGTIVVIANVFLDHALR